MRLASKISIFPFILLIFSPIQDINAQVYKSGPGKTALLELYSSEGCSSCPPADLWVSQLRERPGLWKEFVPAVFHVDYWDDLGWKDRFASKDFTIRQRNYFGFWKKDAVYTPCFILNGREWRDWHQGNLIPKSRGVEPSLGILKLELQNGSQYVIEFHENIPSKLSWEAHLALLGFDMISEVIAGENRGKMLRHNFVVLAHKRRIMEKRENFFFASIDFDKRLRSSFDGVQLGIASWVSLDKDPSPVQATGGFLKE